MGVGLGLRVGVVNRITAGIEDHSGESVRVARPSGVLQDIAARGSVLGESVRREARHYHHPPEEVTPRHGVQDTGLQAGVDREKRVNRHRVSPEDWKLPLRNAIGVVWDEGGGSREGPGGPDRRRTGGNRPWKRASWSHVSTPEPCASRKPPSIGTGQA